MQTAESDTWEVLAVRYGRATPPRDIDYFVWVIRNAAQTILVDCGFDDPSARRRGRRALGDVPALLRKAAIEPADVKSVILTHLHFDHSGCMGAFPSAHFYLQSANLHTAVGPSMSYEFLRSPYDVEHVKEVIDLLYAGRATLYDGDAEFLPGITLHRIDGHATGLQCVRVKTKRGYVVIASDAAPLFDHYMEYIVPEAHIDATAMLKGYDRLRSLATSVDHIVPGHDRDVCNIYPTREGSDYVFELHEPVARSVAKAGERR